MNRATAPSNNAFIRAACCPEQNHLAHTSWAPMHPTPGFPGALDQALTGTALPRLTATGTACACARCAAIAASRRALSSAALAVYAALLPATTSAPKRPVACAESATPWTAYAAPLPMAEPMVVPKVVEEADITNSCVTEQDAHTTPSSRQLVAARRSEETPYPSGRSESEPGYGALRRGRECLRADVPKNFA